MKKRKKKLPLSEKVSPVVRSEEKEARNRFLGGFWKRRNPRFRIVEKKKRGFKVVNLSAPQTPISQQATKTRGPAGSGASYCKCVPVCVRMSVCACVRVSLTIWKECAGATHPDCGGGH